jgi:lipopolysaccharide/colanic/teichoic acid biosynthesis glycosyltransferase
MSIVGPRPLMEVDFQRYPEEIKQIIYNSRPGITGIGSIILRDQETLRSLVRPEMIEQFENLMAPYKGSLEVWYQRNASLGTDIKIIFLTAWVILFPKSNLVLKVLKDIPACPTIPDSYL